MAVDGVQGKLATHGDGLGEETADSRGDVFEAAKDEEEDDHALRALQGCMRRAVSMVDDVQGRFEPSRRLRVCFGGAGEQAPCIVERRPRIRGGGADAQEEQQDARIGAVSSVQAVIQGVYEGRQRGRVGNVMEVADVAGVLLHQDTSLVAPGQPNAPDDLRGLCRERAHAVGLENERRRLGYEADGTSAERDRIRHQGILCHVRGSLGSPETQYQYVLTRARLLEPQSIGRQALEARRDGQRRRRRRR